MPPRPVTHIDIARRLGISQSTVSRALDPAHRHLVRAEVVAAVLKLSAEAGFKGNVLARRLRSRRAETITAVIPSGAFEAPRVPDFEAGNHLLDWQQMHGVLQVADERGYDVKLVPQAGDAGLVQRLFAGIGYPHSDGVVFCGLGTAPLELGELRERGIPWVICGSYEHAARRPLVACDQAPGIGAAVQHLLARGHRRIASLAFAADFTTGQAWSGRHGTVRRLLAAAGCWDEALVWITPDEAALRARLHATPRPLPFTAVLCANDGLAARLVRELQQLGVRVPDEVAVIGFDDNPLYHHLQPALSTIRLPNHEIGRRAAARLIDAIEDVAPVPPLELIPTTFVPRDTA